MDVFNAEGQAACDEYARDPKFKPKPDDSDDEGAVTPRTTRYAPTNPLYYDMAIQGGRKTQEACKRKDMQD